MTDYISTRRPKGTFRRTSVTQGTISSMAKEVVKPDTSKEQKQQRKLNRIKKAKNPDHIQSFLRASIRDSQQQNETSQELKKKSSKKRSGAKMTAPHSVPPSTETRLDNTNLSTLNFHNMIPVLSECEIGVKESWPPMHQRDWMPPSPEEEDDSEGSSSASSFSANFTNDLSIPLMSDEQDIIENLDSSFKTYSSQVKDLLENPGTTDKSFIQECRSLIHQQNSLLNQLEAFSDKKKTNSQTPPLKKSSSFGWINFTQLFQASGVTEVTIHDEKASEPNSIVAVVKGTGTTQDATLLPKGNAYTSYELNITLQAKETAFIFTNDWKPDNSAKQCEFTNGTQCDTKFSFFNRKHHCRRCGHIYCGAHSCNRIPLFKDDKPITSRVCDGCFSTLVKEYSTK